jgi:hypothetical protein
LRHGQEIFLKSAGSNDTKQTARRRCGVAKAVWNVAGQDCGGASADGPTLVADMQIVGPLENVKNLVLTGMIPSSLWSYLV